MKLVKYVGTAGIRTISKSAWKAAELEDEPPVKWHRGNGWTVDISQLSAKAQELILEDPEMVEVSESLAMEDLADVRRMPRDQRLRDPKVRVRTEEGELTTTAQTNVDRQPVIEKQDPGAE